MSSHKDFANTAPGAAGYDKDHPAAAHWQIEDVDRAILAPLPRKKIAICGFASSSRHRMPLTDPSWIICTLNQLYRHVERSDVHFDIHENWLEDNVEGTDHPGWIKNCGIPVYMVQRQLDLPTTLSYPRQALIEKFGVDYFTSTVSYMMAWAIDQIDRVVEPDMDRLTAAQLRARYAEYTIGIFGIDLVVGDEYDFQKAAVEFWIGVAHSRGILVYLPPECALLKQRWAYGFQRQPEHGLIQYQEKLRRRAELQTRFNKRQGEYNQIAAELQTLDGALQELGHHIQIEELRMKGAAVPLGGA